MKRTLSGFLMLVIAALATGCASNGPESYVPLVTAVNGVEEHALVVVIDSRIQYAVACPTIEARITPDGRLDITAHLRDRENHPVAVQVTCLFKDAQGRTVSDDKQAPQPMVLNGVEPQPAHFESHTPNSQRYTICITPGV